MDESELRFCFLEHPSVPSIVAMLPGWLCDTGHTLRHFQYDFLSSPGTVFTVAKEYKTPAGQAL